MARTVIYATIDDAEHFTPEQREAIIASYPPHEREARTLGIPSLGAGAIYPVPFSEISVKPFAIPAWWPRAYGFDVGRKCTAAVWGAMDRSSGTIYLYAEHYRGDELPLVHAAAIKARGDWIRGAVDPASNGISPTDGNRLLAMYRSEGLNLTLANNEVEAGIYAVWSLLSLGRLKVFSTLQNFEQEYRGYHRDEKGKIVKKYDHLMDCFHGDTLVWTDKGRKRIRDLVGTTGRVVTRGGALAEYHSCQMYGENRKVVRMKLSDGNSVVCTPDHLFLSGGEWVQAVDMLGRVCDTAVSESVEGVSWQSKKYQIPFRSSWESGITFAGNIFSATVAAFISLFGSISMAGPLPADSISTTGTTTGQTTSPITLSLNVPSCTFPSTRRTTGEGYQKRQSRRRDTGTAQMKGLSGIASTIEAWLRSCIGRLSATATIAGSAMSGLTTVRVGSAPITAKQRQGEHPASMMNSARAWSAGRSSPSIGTPRSQPVAGSVPVRCLAVEDAGNADVYCLTVPEHSAFAIEGGIIVHNCMRYLVMTWDKVASVQQPERIVTQRPAIGDTLAGY